MNILLAEDEKELSRALTAVLNANGCQVDAVYNGREAADAAAGASYDCILLDVMMPVMDGISALKEIRASGNTTPVIMLTAKGEINDRVDGLDAGADDYLTKPFAMKELLARIRSQVRRAGDFAVPLMTAGNLTLNTETGEISAVNSIRLSRKESRLLELLIANPDKPLSTEFIFDRLWKDETNPEIVWIYISYLRTKLASVGASVQIFGEHGESFILR